MVTRGHGCRNSCLRYRRLWLLRRGAALLFLASLESYIGEASCNSLHYPPESVMFDGARNHSGPAMGCAPLPAVIVRDVVLEGSPLLASKSAKVACV